MKKEENKTFLEQQFLNKLLELNYSTKNKNQKLKEAYHLAQKTENYQEWPHNKEHFWNAEALCWNHRITEKTKHEIEKTIQHLKGKNNLELGAGTHNYLENTTAIDISPEMLKLNKAPKKKKADLEKEIPVKNHKFDNALLPFTIKYIQNTQQLINQTSKKLKPGGKITIIEAQNTISPLHQIHHQNQYGETELRILLNNKKFNNIQTQTKEINNKELLFAEATKKL